MNVLRQQLCSFVAEMKTIASVHEDIVDDRRARGTITHKLRRQAVGDPRIIGGSLRKDRVDRFQRRSGLLRGNAAGIKLEVLPCRPNDTVHAEVHGRSGTDNVNLDAAVPEKLDHLQNRILELRSRIRGNSGTYWLMPRSWQRVAVKPRFPHLPIGGNDCEFKPWVRINKPQGLFEILCTFS